ncbi:putative Ligatin [Haematococcus lacustris]
MTWPWLCASRLPRGCGYRGIPSSPLTQQDHADHVMVEVKGVGEGDGHFMANAIYSAKKSREHHIQFESCIYREQAMARMTACGGMFKKHMPALGVEGKVSGADRKKLRRALEKLFVQLTEEGLEAVLPSKAGDLVMVKLAAPRREVLYRLDGCPLFIDISGKMELVPTVFALWRAPTMLPQLHVKHSAVSQFLVGGADLMLPGVLIPASGLPAFEREQLVSVCVPGNPCPLAVGQAVMSSQEALSRKAGKLVEVLQAYGDVLWSGLGGRAVPNDGFLVSGVVPLGAGAEGLDPSSCSTEPFDLAGGEGGRGDEGGAGAQGQGLGQEGSGGSEHRPSQDSEQLGTAAAAAAAAAAVASGLSCLEVGGIEAVGGGGVGGADTQQQPSAGAAGGPEDMDDLLETVLLQALHKSVKDDALPLSSSVLWSQHMQPVRPASSTLDLKRSRHKKLSSLLKELWRPGRELKPVLEAVGLAPDGLYTALQIREAGFAYVKAAGLGDKSCDPQSLQLDVLLCDALFHGLIKKGELYPTHLAKADLAAAMTRRCSAQVRIQRGAQSLIKKGAVPAISVSVVKRQGSKKVTRVVGMEAFLVSPEELAAESQRKFAASSSVNELPGKSGGVEVVVQGSVAEQMAALLTDRYGVPKKYISVKTEA